MTERTAPTVLHANNLADFLAALPRITGMDATECAFIVMFDGKRTIDAARIDLPPLDQLSAPSTERTHWLREVANLGARAEAVAVVVKTEQQLSARPATSPHGQLTWMICNALAALKGGPRDALVVGSDGWASFAGDAAQPDLRPLSAITSSPLHDPALKNPSLDEWREAHPVVSRLRDGSSATMSGHALSPLVQGAVDRAVAAGAQAVLIMCTGNVPAVTAPVPLYTAEKLARAGMAGLADGRRLGLVVPEPEQQEVIRQRWADAFGIDAAIAPANPYACGAHDITTAARLLATEGAEIVFLDCVGYTQAMAHEVTKITGVPTLTARSLAVRLLTAVV